MIYMNKNAYILSIVAIATLLVFVVVASFAYFGMQGGVPRSVDIKVITSTTDVLTFSVGSDINIVANQSSFSKDKTSLSASTSATASLTANNSTNNTTMNYYFYLKIASNTFIYSQDEDTPELILSITGPSGEVTSLDGYNYKEVTDINGNSIKGFDVTRTKGLVTIANNKAITAGTKSEALKETNEERWIVTLTFVNYDADQTKNAGKEFSAKLIVQKDKYKYKLSDYVKDLYTGIQGENSIYYHDENLVNGAKDYSFRYAGASSEVNNYVCFGTVAEACPNDNLYRIIGVFDDQVKLIKATSIGNYAWDSGGSNTWSSASLNTTTLNGTYLEGFSDAWQSKIATTTWETGGNIYNKIYNVAPAITYVSEITSPVASVMVSAKIGLMYVSDFGYAAASSAWETNLSTYRTYNSINWLYLGNHEWTITRRTNDLLAAYYVHLDGYVGNNNATFVFNVRPTFYLISTTIYDGGSGSISSPFRIN